MWVFTYDAPKGSRVKRYFDSVTVSGLWYDKKIDKWVEDIEGATSSHDDLNHPKTERGFNRYLRKHPNLEGHEVTFVNNYHEVDKNGNFLYSHNITAKWIEEQEGK